MRLLYTFARKYPIQSTIMLSALLLAGLAEGVGLSALFPLLAIGMIYQKVFCAESPAGIAMRHFSIRPSGYADYFRHFLRILPDWLYAWRRF